MNKLTKVALILFGVLGFAASAWSGQLTLQTTTGATLQYTYQSLTVTNGNVVIAGVNTGSASIPSCTAGQTPTTEIPCNMVPASCPDQVVNPGSTACMDPITSCSGGQVPNVIGNQCIAPITSCPTGFVPNDAQNSCRAITQDDCPEGQVLSGGVCALPSACGTTTATIDNSIFTWGGQSTKRTNLPLGRNEVISYPLVVGTNPAYGASVAMIAGHVGRRMWVSECPGGAAISARCDKTGAAELTMLISHSNSFACRISGPGKTYHLNVKNTSCETSSCPFTLQHSEGSIPLNL